MVVIGIILIEIDTFILNIDDINPTAKNPEIYINPKYIYRSKW